jgi:hypothetical protein
MRTLHIANVIASALLLAACTNGSDSIDPKISGGDGADDDPAGEYNESDDCVKIENDEIGAELDLHVGGDTIHVGNWVGKDGEAGEYAGFSYTGAAVFRVKAGGEIYYGSASPWLNPNGTDGSDVKGISNITFCPPDETDAGPGGGGGTPDAGTGTGCNDPDGCDGGTGGPIIP